MFGRVIVFSGIDGCGKTALAGCLHKRLQQQGIYPRMVWMRYNHYSTRFVFLIARLFGFTHYEYDNGKRIVGYHEFYRSKLMTWLFILTSIIDTLLSSIVNIYFYMYICRKTIICDRWIPDILIDIKIDTNIKDFDKSIVAKVFIAMMPNNTNIFLVVRDIEKIRSARNANNIDKTFYDRYKYYYEKPIIDGIVNVDNDGLIEESVEFIERVLGYERQYNQN